MNTWMTFTESYSSLNLIKWKNHLLHSNHMPATMEANKINNTERLPSMSCLSSPEGGRGIGDWRWDGEIDGGRKRESMEEEGRERWR